MNTLFCKLSKNIKRIKAKIFDIIKSPILLGDCGIKEAFCKLCSISIKHIDRNSKFSLINNMLSLLTGLQYIYICHDGQDIYIYIRLVNGGTINDVLRVYCRTRCIIVHGKPTKTMTEGSQRNFPTVDYLEDGLCNRRVAVEYRRLYERLNNEGRYIKLAYQELIGMYRFFSLFGELLDGEYCDCIESPHHQSFRN